MSLYMNRVLSVLDVASAGDTTNARIYNLFGEGQYSVVFGSNPRGNRWVHKRIDWDQHVRQLLHERKFDVEYRMSHRTWKKLHRILKPKLRRLNSRNPDRNRPITVDMIMSAG